MQASAELPTTCLLRLQAIYGSLKRAERCAADLLRTDPEFVQQATISEAAERAGCSQPTFLRLSRRLGYSGFAELKSALKAGETTRSVPQTDTSMACLEGAMNAAVDEMKDTWSMVDAHSFEKAIEVMLAARRLLFFASGAEAAVAQVGAYAAQNIGLQAAYSTDVDEQLVLAAQMTPEDCCIIVCAMGENRGNVLAARAARGQSATVVVITAIPYSPLGKAADILLLSAQRREDISIHFAPAMILDGLLRAILDNNEACKAAVRRSEWMVRSNRIARGGK